MTAQFSRATAMLLVFVAVAGVPLSSDPTALVELERSNEVDAVDNSIDSGVDSGVNNDMNNGADVQFPPTPKTRQQIADEKLQNGESVDEVEQTAQVEEEKTTPVTPEEAAKPTR